MCRWLAYCGSPILLEKALYAPAHSLIEQSLHSTLGAEATNGDGFGIGWYDDEPVPGVFRSIEPAPSRSAISPAYGTKCLNHLPGYSAAERTGSDRSR